MKRLPRPGGERVDDQLRRERGDQDRGRDGVGRGAVGEDQDQRRTEREPRVAYGVQQPRRSPGALGDVDRAPDEQRRGDHERDQCRRDHEQRRDEGELERHRVAGADLEDDPGGEHEPAEGEHQLAGVEAHRPGREEREQDGGDHEGPADDQLVTELA